jgi:uncharacterized protein
MKLVLWAAIIVCVIWILRNKKASVQTEMSTPAARVDALNGERMLCCTHCGLHFPSSEAVADASGAPFCGDEHRRLHALH